MLRRTITILVVSLVIVAVMGTGVLAAKDKGRPSEAGSRVASRALAYSMGSEVPNLGKVDFDFRVSSGKIPVGTMTLSGAAVSPGVVVGNTWYDYQSNGSIGRMIECGPHTGETGYTVVHIGWMYLPDRGSLNRYRSYAYAAYRAEDHSQLSPVYLMTEGVDYGGYVNLDVTPDNRAIVGGHNNPGTTYSPEFHYDGGPAFATFPNVERIPDSTKLWGITTTDDVCWPHFFFQFGTDTVMHVAAQESAENGLDPQSVMYFRKVGFEGSADTEWDYPPYLVDTVADIAQDIIGQRTGDRVCLVWFASLPYDEPWCDTCSSLSVYTDGYGQQDNDIYFQESLDQGATWLPRVNLTKVPLGEASYKAFCDASVLYDSENNLHVIWHACPWPADLCWDAETHCWSEPWFWDNARLMHWSENVPYIRPIADQVYEYQSYLIDSCWAGAWALRISKPSLSECDGKLYAIWSQLNNPKQGVIDDCAEWAYEGGDAGGSANGDLWVSVSEDWGMTWDYQRNLTNSYTPRCDYRDGYDCQSDFWGAMSRTGRAIQTEEPFVEDWTGAIVVDPSGGSYTGNHYLDIMYVNDIEAGGCVSAEGDFTDNPVKWFRLPCVDPIPLPVFTANWTALGDPTYVKPGEFLDTTLILENIGNTELTYTVDVVYDDASSGWLGISGFSGSIPSGLAGTEIGNVRLNDNLMTAYGNYYAHLHFEGNDPNGLPADIAVELIIADTIVAPFVDSIKTSCLGLILSSAANMGRSGWNKLNMDYYSAGDCDTTAKVYLYDGSIMLGWIEGDDTVFNHSWWGANYTDYYGLRPQGGQFDAKYCPEIDAQVFQTGTVTTQDSTIALHRVWVAPQSGDCNFILEYARVWSYDGEPHNGLVIAEGIDWDIPTDFLVDDTNQQVDVANSGGVDPDRNMVYLQGYEAYGLGSDTLYPFNCQDNDARFGGSAFIESYLNGSFRTDAIHGAFAAMNDSLSGGPAQVLLGAMYREMSVSGLRTTDSIQDLHTVITYEFEFDLGASDVYEVVSLLAAVHDGTLTDLEATVDAAAAWYGANGGMAMFTDANTNGQIDACEGCCVEANFGHFYSHEGEFNILDIDNFIEWLLRDPGAPPIYDCKEQVDVSSAAAGVPDGSVDILDVDFMISYLLRGTVPDLGSCP
ncbi:MAG: hypothetical protein JSV52_13860 [Candidatus Zixiibacteriota bacterium]|nr:MAG: hypothetical protein JSV52_13860 [candidate division Zixibacteria bacterium]